MKYNIKKNHEKLRMADGIAGHYIKDYDGKDILVGDIFTISMIKSEVLGSYDVVAIMKDGRYKDLFGSTNYDYSMLQLRKYREEFELLKKMEEK